MGGYGQFVAPALVFTTNSDVVILISNSCTNWNLSRPRLEFALFITIRKRAVVPVGNIPFVSRNLFARRTFLQTTWDKTV